MDAWARAKSLLNQLERAWEGRKKLVMEWQTWSMALDDRETCDKVRGPYSLPDAYAIRFSQH